jgi:hypothetical protein
MFDSLLSRGAGDKLSGEMALLEMLGQELPISFYLD